MAVTVTINRTQFQPDPNPPGWPVRRGVQYWRVSDSQVGDASGNPFRYEIVTNPDRRSQPSYWAITSLWYGDGAGASGMSDLGITLCNTERWKLNEHVTADELPLATFREQALAGGGFGYELADFKPINLGRALMPSDFGITSPSLGRFYTESINHNGTYRLLSIGLVESDSPITWPQVFEY